MATRKKKAKGRGGRPKGLAQTAAAKKKIVSGMKAYWASPEGKKRKAAMRKAGKVTKKRTVRSGKATWPAEKVKSGKATWAAPKVSGGRKRKAAKKPLTRVRKVEKAPVKKRRRSRSPMA